MKPVSTLVDSGAKKYNNSKKQKNYRKTFTTFCEKVKLNVQIF